MKKITTVPEAEDLGDTSTALAILNADNPADVEELELSPVQMQTASQEPGEPHPQVTIDSLLSELGRLNDLDRQRLGALLRRGQRLALHVQSKVALPEFVGWAQDTQHFMNEFGL